MFVGYSLTKPAYRVWNPVNTVIVESRDVEFEENLSQLQEVFVWEENLGLDFEEIHLSDGNTHMQEPERVIEIGKSSHEKEVVVQTRTFAHGPLRERLL